jgi:hypothetical protein
MTRGAIPHNRIARLNRLHPQRLRAQMTAARGSGRRLYRPALGLILLAFAVLSSG